MAREFYFELNHPVRKDIFGRPITIALIYFEWFRGDTGGDLKSYWLYDEHLDDWLQVDIESLNNHQKIEIEKRIRRHMFENPDIFDSEPDEAS